MKKLLLVLLFISSLIARDVKPTYIFKAGGGVIDIVIDKTILYASTDNGEINIFDIYKRNLIKTIKLPKIKDFMGDLMPPKIYSIDLYRDKLAIISEGHNGGKNLYIYENDKLNKLIDSKKNRLFVKEVKFISDNQVLLGLLGNDIVLFDLKNSKEIYRKLLNNSSFSDLELNEDRSKAICSNESGINFLIDTKTGKTLKVVKGENLDNAYKIDIKKNIVMTGGQDRLAGVYYLNSGKSFHFKSNFLIYAVGLSPSGKYGAFTINENNDIAVAKLSTKSKKFILKGQKSTLNSIVFLSDKELITASDDKDIIYWDLR